MSEEEIYERLCERWMEGGPVTAQQYTQREYTEEELESVSADLIAEARERRATK